MSQKKPNHSELEKLLGYRFEDKSLLQQALTHSSARGERGGLDNERLEFLGDRVLGLGVASILYERLPSAREVEFARNYNDLVRKESCAEIARTLDLGPILVMAPSEARSGGRKKDVILADACEALLGAIFVDGGYLAAQSVIAALWGPLIGKVRGEPDPKTALQEFAQSQRRGLPSYVQIERSGVDHAPVFLVEVSVEGLEPARGSGSSLKKAQQAAAEILLFREAVWTREESHV